MSLRILHISSFLRRNFFLKWNKIKFKLMGINIGANPVLQNHIYIHKGKNATICIGNNFTFTSGGGYNPISRNIEGSIYSENNSIIQIGDNVGISSACIWISRSLIIGNNVKIGSDTIILDSDAHSLNYIDRRDYLKDQKYKNNKRIIIEDDVLIGARSIILKGVKIGARSVIGSGSIVTQDIPSDCIAAGNPCKIIKYINS